MQFSNETLRFALIGLDVTNPIDFIREIGYYPIVENLQPSINNTMQPRLGLQSGRTIVGGQSPAHSIRQLNDPVSGVSTLIVGTGTHLATADTALTTSSDRDSGYSGNPINMVPHRPVQSDSAWMYCTDSARTRKVSASGSVKQIGLPAPLNPPSLALDTSSVLYNIIEEYDSAAGWSVAPAATINRINTTVNRVISPATFYYLVEPVSMQNIGVGARIKNNSTTEIATVQETHPASSATTINHIVYEIGASGMVSIYPELPLKEIEVGSVVRINNGGGTQESSVVVATVDGPDGTTSFKCSVSNLHGIGESIQTLGVFGAVYLFGVSAGNALKDDAQSWACAGNATTTISKAITLDLSVFPPTGTGLGRTIDPEDNIHISLFGDHLDKLEEIRIMVDVDKTINDFTRNYYWWAIRPNDITSAITAAQTSLQNRQTRLSRRFIDIQPANNIAAPDILDDGGRAPGARDPFSSGRIGVQPPSVPDTPPASSQTGTGDSQWSEVVFKVGDFLLNRVGTDKSQTLKDVKAISMTVKCGAAGASVYFDSWWIGGGYGPDVTGVEPPLQYRTRGRDSSTGVVSDWSPATVQTVTPHRQQVNVTLATHPSSEVDKIDIQRVGGGLVDWAFVASVANGTAHFIDSYDDIHLVATEGLYGTEVGNVQPWPRYDQPRSGTVQFVAGNLIQLATNDFNSLWAPGTAIKIDGVDTEIYRMIPQSVGASMTTKMEVAANMGGKSSVTWEIPQPVILGQPLATLVGPFYGHFFAWDGHRLRFTNNNDPDATREENYLEFTTPSEPGVNCAIHDNQLYAMTTERTFAITPSFALAARGGEKFQANEVQSGLGAFSQWAITEGPSGSARDIAVLGKNGVYLTRGGDSENITDSRLRKLFPFKGALGTGANGFNAVNMIATQAKSMRLSYADGDLYFNYTDSAGNRRTLVRTKSIEGSQSGWLPFVYTQGVTYHYQAEGGGGARAIYACAADGKVYLVGGGDDAGTAIAVHWRSPSLDFGDGDVKKLFGDAMVHLDPNNATFTLSIAFDNYSTAPVTKVASGAGRQRVQIDVDSGRGDQRRNIALDIAGSSTAGQTPIFYFWEPSWIPRPQDTFLRAGDYDTQQPGVKFARGLWIEADTQGVDRSVLFEYTNDLGVVVSVVISPVNHVVKSERFYPIAGGVYVLSHRLRPTDGNSWIPYGYRLEAEPAPPLSTQPSPWMNPGDTTGARFVQGIVMDFDSANQAVDFATQLDEGIAGPTIVGMTANGRAQQPYDFTPPFITHLIRLIPQSPARVWWESTAWRAQPEPELAYNWQTQQMTHEMPGYHIACRGYLTIKDSSAVVNYTITLDGVAYTVAIAGSDSVGSARRKLHFWLPAAKGLVMEHRVWSTGKFRLYVKDCEVLIKRFGEEGPLVPVNPFGGMHNATGAEI